VKPFNGLSQNKGKTNASSLDFPDQSALSVRGDHFEGRPAEGLTGFVFHTMKDCTNLLFQENERPLVHANVSPKPKSGFMRTWSGIAEADGDQVAPFHNRGHPTVMAVNGLIAVGTENGWVAVMNFKQELKRVCGTEAMG
jgi:hypothetical protein